MSKTLASSALGSTGISDQMLELSGTSRLADSIAGMVSGIDAGSFLGTTGISDSIARMVSGVGASNFLGTTGISDQMLELSGTSRLADSIAGMVSGVGAGSFLGTTRVSDQTAELFRRWEGGDVSTDGQELLGREFSLAPGACPLDDDPSVLQAINMLMRLQRPDLRNDPQALATTTAVASVLFLSTGLWVHVVAPQIMEMLGTLLLLLQGNRWVRDATTGLLVPKTGTSDD